MSFSVSWLSLTNVSTVAAEELLLICVGLPSEAHTVKCLGCIQGIFCHSFPGRRKGEDGIMTCFFPHHRDQFSVSSQGRETTGCSEFCVLLHCQVQPSSSQEMTAVKVEWRCFHPFALSSLGSRSGRCWKSLIHGRKHQWMQNSSLSQTVQYKDTSHCTVCCRLEATLCLCFWVWHSSFLKSRHCTYHQIGICFSALISDSNLTYPHSWWNICLALILGWSSKSYYSESNDVMHCSSALHVNMRQMALQWN